MIYQAGLYGVESFVMFGVTAALIEFAYKFDIIKRFE
jgi:hypothetical protein